MALNVFKSKTLLREYLDKKSCSVGFVPTMGCLHRGHLSLIDRAVSENDLVVVSIFVNPTQFNNPQDLKNYPRTIDQDIDKIRQVAPNALVYVPDVEDIYGTHVASGQFDFTHLDTVMEGKYRKGHYHGVGTVVKRLFEIVKPQRAYFGEKDYQQYKIVCLLVQQQGLPITIVLCPTVREANGLAMSSRNELLSDFVRKKAGFIYNAISAVKTLNLPLEVMITRIATMFAEQNLFKLEYLEIAEEDTLTLAKTVEKSKSYRIFVAVYADGVRLIDNVPLN